jgi:SNF family Na+-dependent transporter
MIYFVVGRAGKLKSAAKFSVCLSLAMFALLSARGLLYKNSLQALAALFLPNIAKLTSGRLWLDALSQMLLSLSLAAGVMPTFAADCATLATKKCAAIIAGANFFGCMLSSVALFTCMFGCGLFGEVTSSFSTFQAAFVVYPAAIRQMFKSRLLGNALGFAFYISLFFTAMQSALSLISPLIKSISFGSGKNLKQSAGRICVCLCLLILPFACKFRLQLINSCDFLACTIIAPILCAGECILLAGQTIFSRYKNGKGAV